MKKYVLIFIVLFLFAKLVNAQHIEHEKHDNHKTEHQDDDHHADEHHFNKFHIALFNGVTSNFDHDISAYTIGVDFEYRPIKMFGIGVGLESILIDEIEYIISIPIFFHPAKGAKIVAAPIAIIATGVTASENGHKSNATEDSEATETKTYYGTRIGIGYDFHISKLSVGPFFAMDWAHNTYSLAYGITVGIGF